MKLRVKLFLLAITLIYFIWSFILLKKDEIPPLHDACVCYGISIHFFHNLFHDFKIIFSNINFYPPLYMILPLPFYKIFGTNPDIFALLNIIYFYILFFSIYKIANFINTNGIIAVCILLTFPVIIGYFRITHLCIAVTAVLYLWLYTLLKTDYFTHKKYVCISAVVFSIGMLEGFHFFIYAFPLFFAYVIFSLWDKKEVSKIMLKKNLLIYLLIVFVTAGLWYIPALYIGNFKDIFKIQMQPQSKFFGYVPFWGRIKDKLFFINRLVLFPNFLIFFISFFLRKIKRDDILTLLFFVFFVPFFTIAYFFTTSNARYILPILPIMSILEARVVKYLSSLKKKIYLLLFLLGYITCIVISYRHQIKRPCDSYDLLVMRNDLGILYPYRSDPKVKKLIPVLKKLSPNKIIILTSDDLNPAPFSVDLLRNEFFKSNINGEYISSMSLSIKGYSLEALASIVENCDYFLFVKNGRKLITVRPEYNPKINAMLKNLFFQIPKKLIGKFKDPQGFYIDEFYLYERKK